MRVPTLPVLLIGDVTEDRLSVGDIANKTRLRTVLRGKEKR